MDRREWMEEAKVDKEVVKKKKESICYTFACIFTSFVQYIIRCDHERWEMKISFFEISFELQSFFQIFVLKWITRKHEMRYDNSIYFSL